MLSTDQVWSLVVILTQAQFLHGAAPVCRDRCVAGDVGLFEEIMAEGAGVPRLVPARRVCFSWDINLAWQLEPDPARSSEVEVTFTPEGPARTRVVLTNRHFDRHGDGWQNMRDAVGSGWDLTRFAEIAAQH